MYKIKSVKGSLPKALKATYDSYDKARTALRKYLREKFGPFERSTHPPLAMFATEAGLTITKV